MAIQISKPVALNFHAKQTDELVEALLKKTDEPLTFISWEHKNLVKSARTLISKTGGDPTLIPSWSGTDFDSIYVIRLDAQQHFKSFIWDHEGLDGVLTHCPPSKLSQSVLSGK